jgi:hypothetical protein
MSALPDEDTEATENALRAARHAVEEASRQLDDLVTRLAEREAAIDQLESVLDVVLATCPTQIVVVDSGRRVTALSRAAAARTGGEVGSAVAEVVPDDAARRIGELIDVGGPAEDDLPGAGDVARVWVLPTGHAVVVLAQS